MPPSETLNLFQPDIMSNLTQILREERRIIKKGSFWLQSSSASFTHTEFEILRQREREMHKYNIMNTSLLLLNFKLGLRLINMLKM
jgi:hypothetical protein